MTMIAESLPPVDPPSVNPGSFTPTALTPARLRSLIGEHFPDAPHAVEDLSLRAFARALWQDGYRAGCRARAAALDHAGLVAQGYAPTAPDARTYQADALSCGRSACAGCGHVGLHYQPFTRREPASYRGFAICPSCGRADEF